MKRTTGLNKTWLLGGAAAVVILGGAGLYFLNDKPGVAAGPAEAGHADEAGHAEDEAGHAEGKGAEAGGEQKASSNSRRPRLRP